MIFKYLGHELASLKNAPVKAGAFFAGNGNGEGVPAIAPRAERADFEMRKGRDLQWEKGKSAGEYWSF